VRKAFLYCQLAHIGRKLTVADSAQLLPEYVEIESGKKNHRPQLLTAIAESR
jgi:hypothetical protein